MTKSIQDAVFLIDDGFLSGHKSAPVKSGWDADLRDREIPQDLNASGVILACGKSNKNDVFIKRNIRTINDGFAGFFHTFTVFKGEGFNISFLKNDTDSAIEITSSDEYFLINGEKTNCKSAPGTHRLYGEISLDDGSTVIYIDGVNSGTFKLRANSISTVKIAVKKGSETCISAFAFHMWINYLICDKFRYTGDGTLIGSWKITGNGSAFAETEYNLECEQGENVRAERFFKRCSGNMEVELKYLIPMGTGLASFSVTDAGKEIITLTDDGENLLYNEKNLRHHQKNVWQTLRIVTKAQNKTVEFFLNGKYCGEFSINSEEYGFDGIKISNLSSGCISFCEILVSEFTEHSDYVPEPVVPEKNEYIVGINTCSLWRNGHHIGWDVITPFEENEPYLGYYDEGLAETSDWEIKWMSEHGIDFEFFCWFNSRNNSPIKKTGHSAAIHDGYFKAKYSDYLKFAIIWEAVGGGATNEDNFKNFIVPYWIDYFFSDDRYMKIDNKVVIAVFGAGKLVKDFGSAAKVKKMFEYLNEQLRKIGLDGAILLSCSPPTETVKECGFDGVYAYNWGDHGCCPEYTRDMISSQTEQDILHVVPTVSTGFNSIAWHGKRFPQMKTSDMGKLFSWIKNDYLPSVKESGWQKNMVMLSTWNEYGEGTFIFPSKLCGFGYLDEIRKAFTEDVPHKDIIPTDKQKARTGYLFPENRCILLHTDTKFPDYPDTLESEIDVSTSNWETENEVELTIKDGVLCGKSTAFDPQLILSGLSIDTSIVKNIRITMRARSFSGYDDRAVLYFTTDTSPNYSESKGTKCATSAENFCECNFYVGELDTWNGTVTSIRLDPIVSKGIFEIQKIELLADNKTLAFSVNDLRIKTTVQIKSNEYGIYFPFESYASFGDLKFYSEWNKTSGEFLLVCNDKRMIFTDGSNEFSVNGEKLLLPEPFTLYDGLPMIHLDTLCKICGFTYSRDGRFINLKI